MEKLDCNHCLFTRLQSNYRLTIEPASQSFIFLSLNKSVNNGFFSYELVLILFG